VRIRKNDQVVLLKAITGAKQLDRRAIGKEEAGSVARVLKVLPDSERVIVEGVSYVYRHVRRSQKHPQGGRVAKEAPIHVSNVALFCAKCDGPARVRMQVVEKKDSRGKRRRDVLRVCKKCGDTIGGAR
jgi:large subunit ribosomal protein L24